MSARQTRWNRLTRGPVEGYVRLIGVGDLPGVPASSLTVGDRLTWNYGGEYLITRIEPASKQFINVWERDTDGKVWGPRRLKKDRLVVKIPDKGTARQPQQSEPRRRQGSGKHPLCYCSSLPGSKCDFCTGLRKGTVDDYKELERKTGCPAIGTGKRVSRRRQARIERHFRGSRKPRLSR